MWLLKALLMWTLVLAANSDADATKHTSKGTSSSSSATTTTMANGTESPHSSSSTTSTTPHTNGSTTTASNVTTTSHTTTPTTTNENFRMEYHNESTIMRRLNPAGNAEVQAQCGKHLWNENSIGTEWSAVLVDNKYHDFFCVATIISVRHLLTAGDCFRQLEEGRADRTAGASLYLIMSCPVVVEDNHPACAPQIFPNYTLVDVEMAFYVWNKDEEWSHDIAIIQLKEDLDPVKYSARPACLRSDDAATQYTTFTMSPKRKFVAFLNFTDDSDFGRNGSFNDVCHSPGLRCVHQEISDNIDAELHVGTGVFGAYELPNPDGSVKLMYFFYGFILDKVRDESLLIIREAKSLLFDLCFYTGVCTDEMEASRNDESKLQVFLDMAYIPELHGDKTSSPKPTNDTEDYSLLNNQPVKRIPYASVVANDDDDSELYGANHNGVDQPSDDGDSDGLVKI